MQGIAIVVLIAILAYPLYNMWRSFYYLFDHTECYDESLLSFEAKIVKIHTEKVKYSKNGMKYKTTVFFSDGFRFITHKTNREEGFFTYQISIDESLKQEIVEKAMRLHLKAVERISKRT